MSTAAIFAAVFIALYIAHSVGDHWVQTSAQSDAKGKKGWAGRLADTRHVLSLTLTKGITLTVVTVTLDIPVTALGITLGIGLDAVSHWWADRRSTLAWLAKVTRKSEFYDLGTGAHPKAPVNAEGKPAAHLGTGSYALDQSFHHLFLGIAALLIATL